MTKTERTIQGLTAEAKQALVNVGTNRQGVKVFAPGHLVELRQAMVIGPEFGLTRFGTIVRQALMTQIEQEMFA